LLAPFDIVYFFMVKGKSLLQQLSLISFFRGKRKLFLKTNIYASDNCNIYKKRLLYVTQNVMSCIEGIRGRKELTEGYKRVLEKASQVVI
tara:strand:+ start:1550 stop:1819 length:270 start_codon:yes stop_codon:yes gene_type:complete